MEEALSPNPHTTQKQRAAIAARIRSPTTPFFLGSNDDKFERAQSRAARAAAIRRKSIAASLQPPPSHNPNDFLDKSQILELYQNCIKLASENKINQRNTWELNLIDHLNEIIKVEEEDVETNFQKASCTLEAGVKIYSTRVDSVHSEAYKVLGGINRVGQEREQDQIADATDDNRPEPNTSKKEAKKLSLLSTLEPTFEALNVKKFDVAFTVDPLYHQTSAQFDEGGAKGLLLNNLGVYGACRVLFDSSEVPEKCMESVGTTSGSDVIDLSFAQDCIEKMVSHIQTTNEISPTLSSIISRFDEDNIRPPDTYSSNKVTVEDVDYGTTADDVFETNDNWNAGQDDQTIVMDEPFGDADVSFHGHHEDHESVIYQDSDTENRFDNANEYPFFGIGINSKKHNAWAGPDHWKYQKAYGPLKKDISENEPKVTTKKAMKRKTEVDICFSDFMDKDMLDVFAPPKNPKSLLLPANRVHGNTKLPEDCHYKPENLVKLFLMPDVMCLGRRQRKHSDKPRPYNDDYGTAPSWDDENSFVREFDDGSLHSDTEDSVQLVSQPRQVNKIEVNYDKTSKVVDVQALKVIIWDQIQESTQASSMDQEAPISFRGLLANFPADCQAAAAPDDISPHLCFICLLHLANEHSLNIQGCPTMDDLTIHLPQNHSSPG
uniref:Condensin complex subunit 2 n=1 Tax=Kalanchoe fedtschenkoi TaxID=63787 RepID=A0A7N0TU02_KALFE